MPTTRQLKIGLSNADKTTMKNQVHAQTIGELIDAYSSSSTYAVGDYVNKDAVIYKCTTAITTPEAWNSAHWSVATLNDVIDAVNQAVASVTGKANITDLLDGTLIPAKTQVAQALETEVGKYDRTPFAYMTSGGQTDIESGIQKTLKLVGCDVVKNQLNNNNGTTGDNAGITYTKNNDGSWTLSGTATALSYRTMHQEINFTNGHKYLLLTTKSNDNVGFYVYNNSQQVYPLAPTYGNSFVFTSSYTLSANLVFIVKNATDLTTALTTKVYLVDLTQRYGSNDVVNAIIGTDTSKQVERLLQFDPAILEDTEYDTGSFPTIKSKYLKSVGYNLFSADNFGKNFFIDGQTGVKGSGSYCGTASKIRVMGNSQIGIIFPSTSSGGIFLYEYDINGNFIGASSRTATTSVVTFTLSPNCAYIEFCKNQTYYGTEYKNDVSCFLYWDGSRIGYEEYEEKIEPLPNVQLHGILKVDENVNVYADGDELYPDGVGNKRRYGSYTFTGNEVWGHSGKAYYTSSAYINNLVKKPTSDAKIANILCESLVATSANNLYSNGDTVSGIAIQTVGNIWIGEIDYANISNLTGKTIIFELAEEQELEADTFNPNLWADDFGTLQFLDEYGNEIKGLQGCEIFYKANIAGFSESLYVKAEGEPDNVVVKKELEPFTDKDTQLLNALGGTLRQLLAVSKSIDFLNTDVIDLGDYNWQFNGGTTNWFYLTVDNIKTESSNLLCSKYKTLNYGIALEDKCIKMTDGQVVVIIDNSFNGDTTAFKNAMKGVLLAYEKASE